MINRHTDRPNYTNPRCTCVLRVNNIGVRRRVSELNPYTNIKSPLIILSYEACREVVIFDIVSVGA